MHLPRFFPAVPSLAPWRRLLALLLLLLCATGVARAATFTFNTDKIDNCTRQGKVYTCTKLPLANDTDRIVIASGVTVIVNADVAFGYNQGLAMSGTARLTSSGNLSIADVAPNNLAISGGSFAAGKTFSVGNQVHDIKADIDAASLMLGTGSGLKITGKVNATGAVQIGSNTTITGAVGGASIAIGTPVKIYGPVTSSGPVQIGSGAVIEGAISGTVVTAGAPVTITGNVTASTSFTLDSGSTVTGDVDTGRLTIYASESTITGSAKVDSAVLYWHGKVAKTITCKKGTAPGKCDCVDNQSGWDVNTANGPRCEAAKPTSSPLDHFLIEHDNSAGTCTAAKVKVTACGDAACSTRYTGGATVTLQPGGASVTIDSSGVSTAAQVTSIAAGKARLSLSATSPTPSAGLACRNNGSGATSCDMDFTGGVNFNVTVPDHKAGNSVTALIRAMKANETNSACVPGYVGEKSVDFSCSYTLPASGKLALELDPTPDGATNDGKSLMCGGANKQALGAVFDSSGTAKVGLRYPDAGRITLDAAAGETRGKTSFVVAPDRFKLSAPSPLRAGLDFELTVQALEKNGAVTPNFDAALLGVDAPAVKIERQCIKGDNLVGSLTLTPLAPLFKEGSAKPAARFSDVGSIDVKATLESFIGVKQTDVYGSTNDAATGCAGKVGPFVPMYYQLELSDATRLQTRKDKTTFSYYYSDEPIRLRVSAMNAQGEITANYPLGYGAGDAFEFLPTDAKGDALAANLGQLAGALGVADFTNGVASWDATRKSPQARYRFTAAQTAPTTLRLRVQTQNKAAGYLVTSADAEAYKTLVPEKARPEIRAGRLRIGSRFGPARSNLDLPLTAEYWSGNSWLRNDDDNFTLIPAAAFALDPSSGPKPVVTPAQLSKGAGTLRLRRDSVGSIDVAVNLGATATDSSCLSEKTGSTGAAMPWLQSRSGCTDPSARATFGVQSTENRRIIHVREAYR